MSDTLPPLHPAAKALSEQLLSNIKAEIKQTGNMSFSRYMELALYAPEFGYYRNALKKFGKTGDFVTAPEISSLFSECVANQCSEVLQTLNGGDILEFGAGSGAMAADILCALQKKNQLPNHYYILEISAFLKSTQAKTIQAKIPNYFDHVVWLTALPEEPINGVILANEVLDAMPVHQFSWHKGIKERCVTIENNELASCISEKENHALIAQVEKYNIQFSEGYTSEVNLYLPGWIKSISKCLSRGAVLIMDYGFPRHEYYHSDRNAGTIMCHYRHRAHSNPLILPGVQDITAHLDFTAVAESAEESGLTVSGFTNQAAFLINCGLMSLIDDTCDEKARFLQNQQILQLTMPSEMGELFKVIGLTKNIEMTLMGFSTMNQMGRL